MALRIMLCRNSIAVTLMRLVQVGRVMAQEDHWLPGFNFNVEEWDAKGQTYETRQITSVSPNAVIPRAPQFCAFVVRPSLHAEPMCVSRHEQNPTIWPWNAVECNSC